MDKNEVIPILAWMKQEVINIFSRTIYLPQKVQCTDICINSAKCIKICEAENLIAQ